MGMDESWRNRVFGQALRLGLALLFFGLASSNSLMSIGLGVSVMASLAQWKRWPAAWWKGPMVWGPWLWWLALLWPLLHGGAQDLIFRDVQMKLGLLLFPLVLPALALQKRAMVWAMAWAAAGVVFAVLWGSVEYFRAWPMADPRTFSPFVSNVRLATLLVLTASWFLLYGSKAWVWGYAFFALLVLLFMQSFTGLLGAFLFLVYVGLSSPRRWIWLGVVVVLAIGGGSYLFYEWHFYKPDGLRAVGPSFSPNQHPYKYQPGNPAIENGHYVWDFVSPGDLHRYWPERSTMPLEGLHAKGGSLYHCLVRYMTSRGMRKDAYHLRKLSDDEIRAIEQGTANWLELQRPAIRARVNAFFRDLHQFSLNGDPNGKSFALRLVLWKTTWHLALQKPWFGHGMGNLRPRLAEALEQNHPGLEARYRLNPHQQWLSLWAKGGLPSVVLFVLGWGAVWFWKPRPVGSWFFGFWFLMSFAFLGEDVLDTQAGLYQFTAFWVLGGLHTINSQGHEA